MRHVWLTASFLLASTFAKPMAPQDVPRLTLQFEDYAALPVTADHTNTNTDFHQRPSLSPQR